MAEAQTMLQSAPRCSNVVSIAGSLASERAKVEHHCSRRSGLLTTWVPVKVSMMRPEKVTLTSFDEGDTDYPKGDPVTLPNASGLPTDRSNSSNSLPLGDRCDAVWNIHGDTPLLGVDSMVLDGVTGRNLFEHGQTTKLPPGAHIVMEGPEDLSRLSGVTAREYARKDSYMTNETQL